MKNIQLRIENLYQKHNLVLPWHETRLNGNPRKMFFFGAKIEPREGSNKITGDGIISLRSIVQSPVSGLEERINISKDILIKSGTIASEDVYQALPVIKDWTEIISGKDHGRGDAWIRESVPKFIAEKDRSIREKTFCFFLDNKIIPHDLFNLSAELNMLLDYYGKYQIKPGDGLPEKEKGELAKLLEFFSFLQLDNPNVLRSLANALKTGIELDIPSHSIDLTGPQKHLIQENDMRWRILKIIRWTPTNDSRIIELAKTFVNSPNLNEQIYSIGYLGKAAGRLFNSDPKQSENILQYLMERKPEIQKKSYPYLLLEIIKALMGDWDSRQPYLRRYLGKCDLSIAGLEAIARDENMDASIRKGAIEGLNVLVQADQDIRAKDALIKLSRSKSYISRTSAILATENKLPKITKLIHITSKEQQEENRSAREQLHFYRGMLYPYTRLCDWEDIGLTMGRGTSLFKMAIQDKKWLGIQKVAPTSLKLSRRSVIPAVERITSSLGWILGMPYLSKIQLVEDEGSRDTYIAHAVGQRTPLTPEIYEHIISIKMAEEKSGNIHLSGAIRDLLNEKFNETDMDTPMVENDPLYGEVVRSNRYGSTISFFDRRDRDNEAKIWFEKAKGVFSNAQFLDQIKFFNWIVGNEDQSGFRNILVSKKRQNNEPGNIFLIDFASCFRFLQRQDLNWTDHLQQFYLNLHMTTMGAPEIFKDNIRPLIVNFLHTSESALKNITNETRYGELTEHEKNAIWMLLLAEQEILAEEFIDWSGRPKKIAPKKTENK